MTTVVLSNVFTLRALVTVRTEVDDALRVQVRGDGLVILIVVLMPDGVPVLLAGVLRI